MIKGAGCRGQKLATCATGATGFPSSLGGGGLHHRVIGKSGGKGAPGQWLQQGLACGGMKSGRFSRICRSPELT